MKSFLNIAMGVVALSFVQPASATSFFTLDGATSSRVAIYDTIVTLMGGTPSASPPNAGTAKISTTASGTNTTAAAGRTAVNSSNTVTFQGTISGINNNNPVTIYVQLNGSATGLIALYAGTSLNYATAPTAGASAGYDRVTYGVATTNTPGAPKFAFSEIFQNSVISTRVNGLTDDIIGVQPYNFVANKGSTLTNITSQNARLLYNNGVLAQSFLTGNPADTNNVYATGRDIGSGARIAIMAETKYGITPLVNQYFATTSGTTGSGSIVSLRYWPISGSFGNVDPLNAGNGGYGSGTNISSLMGFTGGSVNILDAGGAVTTANDPNVAVVGYVGAADVVTAVANGGVRLKYDGVQYTGPSDNALIQNGGYTLWSYTHIASNGTASGDDATFLTAFKNNFSANLGSTGISIASMNVSRTGDGELVGP